MTIPTITDDLIAEIEEAASRKWSDSPNEERSISIGQFKAIALTARIRELEKDAARYAYLRQQNNKPPEQCTEHNDFAVVFDGPDGGEWVGIDLDAAIDAAMQADT